MRPRFACLSGLALAAAASSAAFAQVSIDQRLTVESFDGYAGAGFAAAPAAGQLDSDEWRLAGDDACNFGATCTGGNYGRGASAGDVTTGGLYAFTVEASNPAFGWQPTSQAMTPGAVTLRLVNDTGAAITTVSFEYSLWVRNNEGSSQSVAFAYSTDDATYVTVAALGQNTPTTAGADVWVESRLAAEVTGLSIADGATFYLRWTTDDASGSGARDEIAIDDITVRLPGCGDGVVAGGETCDDGDETDGQGCLADCSGVAPGWECAGTQPTVCTDIDECDLATDTCVANSTCDNTPGSYDCPCDAGYEGDGQVACTDIDECSAGTDTCDDNADCDDIDGSFTCTCRQGWEGSGQVCTDIDECEAGTHDCGTGNLCINTDGSWDCACENGYDWDGSQCVDVDECAEGLAACDANATCDNFAGGFSCDCNAGFEGDGLSCTETDTDGDDIPFSEDNCPGDANPGQEDSDGDGRGDACDYVDDGASGEDEGGCGCRAAAPGSTLATLLLLGLALLPIRRRRR
ncbi:MAG TPA: EGF domain-containing protein [Kofleriaceae bacterium]|nr:EGF domain-containing protein [Kofleriaceae bacterium]